MEVEKKDLVCEREMENDATRFSSEYDHRKYLFCSAECKQKFDDHPDYFIHEQAKRKLSL